MTVDATRSRIGMNGVGKVLATRILHVNGRDDSITERALVLSANVLTYTPIAPFDSMIMDRIQSLLGGERNCGILISIQDENVCHCKPRHYQHLSLICISPESVVYQFSFPILSRQPMYSGKRAGHEGTADVSNTEEASIR